MYKNRHIYVVNCSTHFDMWGFAHRPTANGETPWVAVGRFLWRSVYTRQFRWRCGRAL